MAGILDTVDQRTQLVGENRLEILMFQLSRGQTFAINVFKIQEVQQMPKLTVIPDSHPAVVGVTHTRGRTIPVIDLSRAIGMPPLTDTSNCNVIIAEYNMTIQAFMVKSVDRIINLNWGDILPPPKGAGRNHYLTAITRVDGKVVEVIDVEKVLQEISPYNSALSEGTLDDDIHSLSDGLMLLSVDDSMVGIAQVEDTAKQIGVGVYKCQDGAKALQMLQGWANSGEDLCKKLVCVVTDAEMPEMDGYMLTAEIRKDPRLCDLPVILHTSLSGSFNKAMVEKVGCDDFLSKFEPDQLASTLQKWVKSYREKYPVD
ncbi:MAG: chemotaxis protein [Pseudomonadales bacterium]|nr:chemotaxis protein [Pseudomonadales bacterium]